MTENTRRFSLWFPIDEQADSPPGAVVIQIKVADRLLTYPAGRSAMVWYGSGLSSEILAVVAPRLRAALPGERLLWRYLEDDAADVECARHLRRFKDRFGAQPRLNEAPSGRGPRTS